ncbi:MAG: hypothetical protein KDC61_14620, partial [Saprospiraceae bacterium]|nr:hypothetical protein [Saprospiraceae bacterium]
SWTERLHWEQSFLTETARAHDRKLILSEQQVPMDKLIFSWGTSTEFLILSSLDGPDGARCILVDENPARFDSLRSRRELFLGEFRNYLFDEIPRRYFNLRDTSAYVNYRE